MKVTRTLLVLISLLLITGGVSLVADEHGSRHEAFHLKLDGGDHIAFELEDLEIGETRQFFTDEGKEVLVTRTEEGLELEVDGKKIDLGIHSHDDGLLDLNIGEGGHRVKIHAIHGEEGHGEGEHSFVWVGDGEEGDSEHSFSFITGGSDARTRLEESGVLDELDEETRQKILEVLDDGQIHEIHTRSKVIVIDSKGEEDEEG